MRCGVEAGSTLLFLSWTGQSSLGQAVILPSKLQPLEPYSSVESDVDLVMFFIPVPLVQRDMESAGPQLGL